MRYGVLSCFVVLTISTAFSCGNEGSNGAAQQQAPAMEADSLFASMESGLKYRIIKEGSGEIAGEGNIVVVHYTGWLENGQQFDSSRDRNEPFRFTLGHGEVIEGWDKGVIGMKVGEVRKLIIPPALAYGEEGFPGGVIPPNATLTFEVELLGVK